MSKAALFEGLEQHIVESTQLWDKKKANKTD
jgi:hypothetical protein